MVVEAAELIIVDVTTFVPCIQHFAIDLNCEHLVDLKHPYLSIRLADTDKIMPITFLTSLYKKWP